MLDQASSTPLHQQLKERLRAQFSEGHLKYGERIPSERELCRAYGVSRITVRMAIGEAVSEGWLYRRQGKGTFVGNPQVEQGLSRIVSFTSTMQSAGLKPSTAVLGWRTAPADMTVAHLLHLTSPAIVFNLQLVGFGNGAPMVFYDSCLREEVGPDIIRAAERGVAAGEAFSTVDLYDRRSAAYPVRAEQTFEACGADRAIAGHLGIQPGDAVFLITSVFFGPTGQPLEFRKAFYRGSRYRFYLTRAFS